MTKSAPIDTTDAPRHPSPLWIIALFIALSELTAGISAVITDGTTRMIFAIFAVGFPVAVLIVFIWLLLRHPANLYSPSEYAPQTSVEGYAAALSREYRATSIVHSQAISEAIASASAPGGMADSPALRAFQKQVAETFERLVEDSSVTVDRSFFLDEAEPVQIPVTAETTADELLDSIFMAVRPAVEPFSYTKSWVLAGEGGMLLTDLGTRWAKENGRSRDERALREVGIAPGSKMVIVQPPDPSDG